MIFMSSNVLILLFMELRLYVLKKKTLNVIKQMTHGAIFSIKNDLHI